MRTFSLFPKKKMPIPGKTQEMDLEWYPRMVIAKVVKSTTNKHREFTFGNKRDCFSQDMHHLYPPKIKNQKRGKNYIWLYLINPLIVCRINGFQQDKTVCRKFFDGDKTFLNCSETVFLKKEGFWSFIWYGSFGDNISFRHN